MKVGGPGTPIDIPLGHINAAYVHDHFDAMEVRLPDAPRSGRDHVRAGDVTQAPHPRPDGRADDGRGQRARTGCASRNIALAKRGHPSIETDKEG